MAVWTLFDSNYELGCRFLRSYPPHSRTRFKLDYLWRSYRVAVAAAKAAF